MRYWIINRDDGKLINEKSIPLGIKFINHKNFENILVNEFQDYLLENLTIDILCCGMIGSKQGWKDSGYFSVPFTPEFYKKLVFVKTKNKKLNIYIVPGLKQSNPPDVMRGEETQSLGIIKKYNNFDGVICFTGTHSKWVQIVGNEIISFETFLTGELFQIISEHSILKQSISTKKIDINLAKEYALIAFSDPHKFSKNLFELRAKNLIDNLNSSEILSCLSGLIIGLEIAGSRKYWLGNEVILVGSSPMVDIYKLILNKQNIATSIQDSKDISLIGLKDIYKNLN